MAQPDTAKAPPPPVTKEEGTPPPPPVPRFYAMEKTDTGARSLANSREDCAMLTDVGYGLVRIFLDRSEADAWVQGTDVRGVGRAQFSRILGPDRSTTKQEVFGKRIDKYNEVERTLLPGGIPFQESEKYYDCVTDVMSLPGGYRVFKDEEGVEDHKATEVLMAIAEGRKETGLHMRYGAAKNNALREIKSHEDLSQFLEDTHDSWEEADQSMTSQLTRRMHRDGFDDDYIEDYLQAGVLVRVVHDTYRYYLNFLTVLTGFVGRMNAGDQWKDSVACLVLTYHKEKLALIRDNSASYRDLVLRNYAYMRDEAADSFWNSKLNKRHALASARLLAEATAPTRSTGATGGGGANFCATCRRKHSGNNPCPVASLTAAERARLGNGLRQREYEKALRFIRDKVAATPGTSVAGLIDEARLAGQESG